MTVFPYFPIEWVDASRQSPITYPVADSLRLGCSCKRAFREKIWIHYGNSRKFFMCILERFLINVTDFFLENFENIFEILKIIFLINLGSRISSKFWGVNRKNFEQLLGYF